MPESLKRKTVKGVVWSGVERFSTMGVGFLLGLVIARLLSPEDYGVIAMLSIFMAVAQTFIDSGFSSALVRKIDRTEKDNSTVFYFNIAVAVACYILLFIAAPWIAKFYETPILTSVTRVIGLNLIINSICGVQNAMISIRLDFKLSAKISLITTIFSGVIGIILAYLGYGPWALVWQQVLSGVLRNLMLWFMVKWRPTERFSKESFKNLFGFGSKLLASGLLDTIYNNIYPIVIGKCFSASSLGLYARADHLAQFPSSNVTGIIQRVTFPVLAQIQDDDERLGVNYRKMLRLSAFIIFPLMMGLAGLADPLIRFILTDKWEGAIILLQILCFSLMWYPVHAINLNLLQVKGRSDLFLKLEIIKKIMGVALLVITIPMGLIAMCVGRIVTSIIALVINTYYTGKLINVGFFKQMRDLMPTLINSLIMGGLAYGCTYLFESNIVMLIVGTLVGATYYFTVNWLFKTVEWQEFIKIIKRQ